MFKPTLEVLEDRTLPSGSFGIGNAGFFNGVWHHRVWQLRDWQLRVWQLRDLQLGRPPFEAVALLRRLPPEILHVHGPGYRSSRRALPRLVVGCRRPGSGSLSQARAAASAFEAAFAATVHPCGYGQPRTTDLVGHV